MTSGSAVLTTRKKRGRTVGLCAAILILAGSGIGSLGQAALASTTATPAVHAVASTQTASSAAASALPGAKHFFVINLENKGFDTTWGATSAAPYLATTLRSQGVLLTQYFGVAHNSLPNYIAEISGQGANAQTQADCQVYTPFVALTTVSPGQAVGSGCLFPATVPTVAGQLSAAGQSWKGYMEDMATPCLHPAVNTVDSTQMAKVGDEYAARHNPFVYFAEITDSPACATNVVNLNQLKTDLTSVATTPNFSMITPNLCDDGHDAPCVDGRPGGLASADAWLKTWVPLITSSPAFGADGVLVITFDESDGFQSDATACCGEGPTPNAPLPGLTGMGGGRVGALILSKFVKPGTESATPYNHYSLLASIEDTFSLPYLGYAATPGLNRFGADVYNAG